MKIIILTIMTLLLIESNLYADCTIRYRVATDAEPFHFLDSNGNWSGFVTEHGEAVLKEAGCKIIYRKVPWGRALLLLEEGELDMMALMSITEEREKFINFIGPHHYEEMKLLVNEDSEYQIKKHEDLLKIPGQLAMIRGGWFGEEMEQLKKNKSFLKKITWLTTTSTEERMRLGRISAEFRVEIPGMLKTENHKGLKFHPFIINSDPVFFGLSKKSVDPALLAKLQAAFERVKERGEFEKILKRYE